MNKTLTVVFDGQVLQPESPVELIPGERYRVTIEPVDVEGQSHDAWDVLEMVAGTVEAPADWAVQHDHYLYGTPRR